MNGPVRVTPRDPTDAILATRLQNTINRAVMDPDSPYHKMVFVPDPDVPHSGPVSLDAMNALANNLLAKVLKKARGETDPT